MSYRNILIAFVGVVYIVGYILIDRWPEIQYHGDSNGYYIHLVSLFINNDVGDYDKTITSLREVSPTSADPRDDKYGFRLTTIGKRYIKYPLGVPIMELPFFLTAHIVAKYSSKYEANGWSVPYMFAIGISTIFYILFGMYLLIGVLEKLFSKLVVTFVILTIAFATNLYYHGTYITMAHGFLFFDYCLLIYIVSNFYKNPGTLKALAIGSLVGLISLTRVPEVISILIPALWGISSLGGLKLRMQFFVKNYNLSLFLLIGFCLIFSIQIGYWYYVSGQLYIDSYSGETFNFLRPKILNGWFHFSNGWLIYTPIMALSLIGLIWLRKYPFTPFLAIIIFVGIHVYIHYSWHAWRYYPGFGSRPMVETYPLLSFGLAAFYAFCFKSKWLKWWLPTFFLIFFSGLNLFQIWQTKNGIIRSERGNKAFYIATFGKTAPTINSLRAYDSKETQPDIQKLNLLGVLYKEGFEDTTKYITSSDIKYTGEYSLIDLKKNPDWKVDISSAKIHSRDWLEFGVHAYMKKEDNINSRGQCEHLVVVLFDENNKQYRWRSIKISRYLGNEKFSIWPTGKTDMWGSSSFFMRVPRKFNKDWKIRVSLWNPQRQKLYLDDFFVNHYRAK